MDKKNKNKKKSKGQLKREKEQSIKLEKIKLEQEKNKKESVNKIKKKNPSNKINILKDKVSNVKWTRDVIIDNLSMSPINGSAYLIKESQLRLVHGHRYGIIGKNGSGKSTLLQHLNMKKFPKFPSHLSIYLVEQETRGTEYTIIDTVIFSDKNLTNLLKTKKELEKENNDENGDELIEIENKLRMIEADNSVHRASKILDGLNFTNQMKKMKTSDLSGGWRMRVALACGLFVEPDILLLDEPTNHLDLPSVKWLTEYLQEYSSKKILVVVSHERKFINDITTDIIYLNQCKLSYYKGNFDQFWKTKTETLRHQTTQYNRQQKEIAHQQDFIRRFKCNKKWATQAQSRMKVLKKMKRIEKVSNDLNWRFTFPEPRKLNNNLLININNMEFGYFGNDETKNSYLLKNINCQIEMGKKIGVVGSNGAGKSTLIKLIMKEINPLGGECFMKNEVVFGYFAQHHEEIINLSLTSIEFLMDRFPGTDIQEIYTKLSKFHLDRELSQKTIRLLSGGEKSRLSFLILTWYNPHLIIMDEPTNHLDIETQDALIIALKNFKGSAIIVSHDKHLLTSCCNEYWVVGNYTLTLFESFFESMTFCYEKCKPINIVPRDSSMIPEKNVNQILKITNTRLPENNKIRKKQNNNIKIFINCEYEIVKGLKKKLKPSNILIHIKGYNPKDGDNRPIDCLVYDMLDKYFTNVSYSNINLFAFFKLYTDLIKYLIPNNHKKNQFNLLNITQVSWFTRKNQNSIHIKNKNLLENILKFYYNLEYISKDVIFQWKFMINIKTIGRDNSLKGLSKWYNQINLELEI